MGKADGDENECETSTATSRPAPGQLVSELDPELLERGARALKNIFAPDGGHFSSTHFIAVIPIDQIDRYGKRIQADFRIEIGAGSEVAREDADFWKEAVDFCSSLFTNDKQRRKKEILGWERKPAVTEESLDGELVLRFETESSKEYSDRISKRLGGPLISFAGELLRRNQNHVEVSSQGSARLTGRPILGELHLQSGADWDRQPDLLKATIRERFASLLLGYYQNWEDQHPMVEGIYYQSSKDDEPTALFSDRSKAWYKEDADGRMCLSKVCPNPASTRLTKLKASPESADRRGVVFNTNNLRESSAYADRPSDSQLTLELVPENFDFKTGSTHSGPSYYWDEQAELPTLILLGGPDDRKSQS